MFAQKILLEATHHEVQTEVQKRIECRRKFYMQMRQDEEKIKQYKENSVDINDKYLHGLIQDREFQQNAAALVTKLNAKETEEPLAWACVAYVYKNQNTKIKVSACMCSKHHGILKPTSK